MNNSLRAKSQGFNIKPYFNFIFLTGFALIIFCLAIVLVLKESAGVV